MTFMKFYFREEEAEYIRSKPKGWVRKIVIGAMASEDLDNATPKPPSPRVVRGPTCRECGGMTLAGRCLVCGRLQ